MSISLDDALSTKKNGRAAAAAPNETIGALGIAQHRVAKLFGVGPRSVRRWQCGDRRVPCGVDIVLRLLAAGTVTIAQVEQAAVPVSAQTNGGSEPEPRAPRLVEPTPEQSELACTTATDPRVRVARKELPLDVAPDDAPAGVGLTTAEKVLALSPGTCRWPCGDPDHPDFRFCGSPVANEPYCDHHRAMAYNSSPMVETGDLGANARWGWGYRRNARAISKGRTVQC
jgi:GcrA cell cycle regulator